MDNEVNETVEDNTPAEKTGIVSMREVVAARLSQIGESVSERVINVLVEAEIEKRKTQVSAAYSEYDDLWKREKRLQKPDVVSYDYQGNPAASNFSKGRLDELKKTRERMTKIEKAIEDALLKSNFEKLNNLGAAMKVSKDADPTDEAGSN